MSKPRNGEPAGEQKPKPAPKKQPAADKLAADKSTADKPAADKLAAGKSTAEPPTVDELATLTGNVLTFKLPVKHTEPNARHQAAAALHGWHAHLANTGKPMRLSHEDYLKALKAAECPPKGERHCTPYKPAISKWACVVCVDMNEE